MDVGLDVEVVVTNTVKSQKRKNGASNICFWGQKIIISKRRYIMKIVKAGYTLHSTLYSVKYCDM